MKLSTKLRILPVIYLWHLVKGPAASTSTIATNTAISARRPIGSVAMDAANIGIAVKRGRRGFVPRVIAKIESSI